MTDTIDILIRFNKRTAICSASVTFNMPTPSKVVLCSCGKRFKNASAMSQHQRDSPKHSSTQHEPPALPSSTASFSWVDEESYPRQASTSHSSDNSVSSVGARAKPYYPC